MLPQRYGLAAKIDARKTNYVYVINIAASSDLPVR